MSDRNVEKLVRKFTDRRDDRLVEIVERCIRKGHDYDKMKDRITEHVKEGSNCRRLIEALSCAFPQFARKSKQKFIERKDIAHEDEVKAKKAKLEGTELSCEDGDFAPGSMLIAPKLAGLPVKEELNPEKVTGEELRSKELMYQAQMTIEERKRQMNLTAKPGIVAQSVISKASKLNVKEASLFMNYSMDKINRVNELKERLARSTALPQLVKKPVTKVKPETDNKIIEYLDPRISLKSSERKRRSIVFHQKGEFESLAHKERTRARLAILQSEISHIAKRTGMSSSVKLAMLIPFSTSSTTVEVPTMEWWDGIVVGDGTCDSLPSKKVNSDERYKKSISNLVEHPIQLKPPDEAVHPQYLKVFLTSKERKKIRRQNRKEAQKEQTEKIRLGLSKAPEPKAKLSNLMRVLGSEAVQDPTKMEAHVRKQMADRQRKHENANAQRKLTKEQRAEKKNRKLNEDTSLSVHVAVYRLKSLTHPSKKFKVEMNAKQLRMTGLILLHSDINLVIVEGGPKQQKLFKHLMLERIKWHEEIIGQKKEAQDEDTPGERNHCYLVWQGETKSRNFGEVKCMSATLEKQARELLDKHDVAHYWDLAYSTSVLKEE